LSDPEPEFPLVALVASGGHSQIYHMPRPGIMAKLGCARDDAAGEAFDKAARAMGLPYPGGVHIDKIAGGGDINKYTLPYPKTKNKYDFSFSGLKTAVINLIHNSKQSGNELDIPSLAASFQRTVCEILAGKAVLAANEYRLKTIALSGGVAANSYLRETLTRKCGENNCVLYFPPTEYCGDNAAMIGCQAYYEFLNGNVADSSLNAFATMSL
jgi:N6-L-threonylcarbamoyladenine synthase